MEKSIPANQPDTYQIPEEMQGLISLIAEILADEYLQEMGIQ